MDTNIMKANNTTPLKFWDRLKISSILLGIKALALILDILTLVFLIIAWIPMLLSKKHFYSHYVNAFKK